MKVIQLLPLLLVHFLAQEVSSSPMTTDSSSLTNGFDCGTVPQPCSSAKLDKCMAECAPLYEPGTCDRISCESCCYTFSDNCGDYAPYLCCYYQFYYEEIPNASCYVRAVCPESAMDFYGLKSSCSSSRFTISLHILTALSLALQ